MNNLKMKERRKTISEAPKAYQREVRIIEHPVKSLLVNRRLSNLVEIDQHREDILASQRIEGQKQAIREMTQ